MAWPESKLERAARHVIEGRGLVARQQALIGRLQRANADYSQAERLLVTFESSLAIFEDLLRRIQAEPTVEPRRRAPADKVAALA